MASPPVSSRFAAWRRPVTAVVVILGVFGASTFALDLLAGGGPETADPIAPPSTLPPVAAAFPSPPEPAPKAPPVLSLSGDFPDDGSGEFRFAGQEGEVLGEDGSVRRFRVGVEEGIDEEPEQFAEFVDATLGHRQSWTASGDLRLQRVPGEAGHDFSILLATSQTAARLCATAGLDVLGGSLPDGGVSCETGNQVVLNLSRWRLSVPEYVDAEVPLAEYRRMLVNHEVGHQLGYGHERCPASGEPAPVMQQQTLRLDGCQPNPWPYLDGERYAGAPVP